MEQLHQSDKLSQTEFFSIDLEEDLEDSVHRVSHQVFSPLEFGKEEIPELRKRTSLLSEQLEEHDKAQKTEMIGTFVFGMSKEEALERAQNVERSGGYVLIPEDREFRKEDCLVGEKAPLWISAKVGGGGIGQSVEMMKEVKDKDKKPDSDEERQAEFDEKFALFKFKLGLTKEDVVNYNINGHSIMIYDKEGNLKGKYDLLDDGLNEDPQNRIRNGGGLKQLLRDRGYIYSDTQVKSLARELRNLNGQMRTIIEPEVGSKLGYVFEAGNKGNIQGLVPFNARGKEGAKVLHSDKKYGLHTRTMQRLDLVDTDSKTWPRSDVHTLNERGAAAINDIHRATDLQRIIMQNMERRETTLNEQLNGLEQRFTPNTPLIPNAAEKKQMEDLQKDIKELNKVKREISGVNPSVLNLMLMQLNSNLTIEHQSIRDLDGRMVRNETTLPAKFFLDQMTEGNRSHFGVPRGNDHEADVVRNHLVDGVAKSVANSFETTVMEENPSREFKHWMWLKQKPLVALDPDKKPSHKEVQQLGTNMGALVHDIAARTSSDPSRLRKIDFIEGRSQSGFAQESRGIELIIAASVFRGQTDLRGFSRENDTVKGVLEESLEEFRRRDHGANQYIDVQPGHNPDLCRTVLVKEQERIGSGISSPIPRN